MIENFVTDTISILTGVQSLREYAAFAQVKGNNTKYKTIETVKKQETSEKKWLKPSSCFSYTSMRQR